MIACGKSYKKSTRGCVSSEEKKKNFSSVRGWGRDDQGTTLNGILDF